jgi:hypothetical protein
VLAAAAFGAAITACSCPIASHTAAIAIVGVEADTAACGTPSATLLTGGDTCTYKATAGYTVAGELSNVCGAGDGTLATTAAPSVTGCVTNYYQSAGTAVGNDGVCSAW